jgi:hypothetical protein
VELKKNNLRSAEFSKFVTLYFNDFTKCTILKVFDFLTSYEMSTCERPSSPWYNPSKTLSKQLKNMFT